MCGFLGFDHTSINQSIAVVSIYMVSIYPPRFYDYRSICLRFLVDQLMYAQSLPGLGAGMM